MILKGTKAMSEENFSSGSSPNNSRRDGPTFSEYATPSSLISSPSFESSLKSSSPDPGGPKTEETYFECSSEASLFPSGFKDAELSFIDMVTKELMSHSELSEDIKVSICDGLQDLGIFEKDAAKLNNSFEVYHEILARIAYHVQANMEKSDAGEPKCCTYSPLNNFVELTVILVHLSNLCTEDNERNRKSEEKYEKTLSFISRLLTTLGVHMNKIHIVQGSEECQEFPSLPYYRFIRELMRQLVKDLKSISSEIISTFCVFLHDISPKSIPIFAFQWLSIIGSGEFLGQVLDSTHRELEVLYSHHLLLLLDYLKPLLQCQELRTGKCVMDFVFGLTRLLFVIHHDFPDFFIHHGFQFIEFVPICSIQLRSIILSTIPSYICPTSPLTTGAFIPSCMDNLEMDLRLLRCNNAELDYHEWCLRQANVLDLLAEYLEGRKPMGFLLELRDLIGHNVKTNPHNLPRFWKEPELRAVICFTAATHIKSLNWTWDNLPTFENLPDSSFMDIYQILALTLDESGRALFFSLVVDRLRYPCVETYYFFIVLARLFTTLKNQIVKEQLVTALMQRILANPPHQWGVLATFTEFIQNPVYNFWSQPFLRRDPSTILLFDTISRTWRRQYEK